MSFSIYRIKEFSEGSNSHTVARTERWEIIKETECNSDREAKEYIREYSKQYTILPNFIQQWRETKQEDRTVTLEELIDQFCFTNDTYLKYRRLFINKPDVKQLAKELTKDGTKIVWL